MALAEKKRSSMTITETETEFVSIQCNTMQYDLNAEITWKSVFFPGTKLDFDKIQDQRLSGFGSFCFI
jgi:hypothetical protein